MKMRQETSKNADDYYVQPRMMVRREALWILLLLSSRQVWDEENSQRIDYCIRGARRWMNCLIMISEWWKGAAFLLTHTPHSLTCLCLTFSLIHLLMASRVIIAFIGPGKWFRIISRWIRNQLSNLSIKSMFKRGIILFSIPRKWICLPRGVNELVIIEMNAARNM